MAQMITQGDMAMVLYRISELDKKSDRIEAKVDKVIDDHETRLRSLEDSVARLAERLTISQIGQGVLTVIGSVLAVVFHKP